ncbi:MAG: hypothetical protein AB7G48_03815 [Nitrospiraceae bacterium]
MSGALKKRRWHAIPLALWLLVGVGCGTIGSPIAPEDVGIGPRLQREQQAAKAREQQSEQRTFSAEESRQQPSVVPDEAELPPLRPIGTR